VTLVVINENFSEAYLRFGAEMTIRMYEISHISYFSYKYDLHDKYEASRISEKSEALPAHRKGLIDSEQATACIHCRPNLGGPARYCTITGTQTNVCVAKTRRFVGYTLIRV
jgi:hypothetical protein